jgi:hypothetical protein
MKMARKKWFADISVSYAGESCLMKNSLAEATLLIFASPVLRNPKKNRRKKSH